MSDKYIEGLQLPGSTDIYKPLTDKTLTKANMPADGKIIGDKILEINNTLSGKANSSHQHGNADITSLDASKITSGKISIDRLPQGALERLVTVANQNERYALTSENVQLGDTVKQLDTGVMYIVTDTSNLGNSAGYTEYTAGSATSVPWSGITDKPNFNYIPIGSVINGGSW